MKLGRRLEWDRVSNLVRDTAHPEIAPFLVDGNSRRLVEVLFNQTVGFQSIEHGKTLWVIPYSHLEKAVFPDGHNLMTFEAFLKKPLQAICDGLKGVKARPTPSEEYEVTIDLDLIID